MKILLHSSVLLPDLQGQAPKKGKYSSGVTLSENFLLSTMMKQMFLS